MNGAAKWLGKTSDYLLRRDAQALALHLAYVVFACSSLALTFYRDPWRDEAQAWLLARDLSPWGLFMEARRDGHPILWHLCLKLVQAIGIDWVGMMLLNWAFMAIAIWLLFYRSTLPLAARIVVALCPACIMEVSCTARNYAISAALMFVAAAIYRNAAKRPVPFTIVLALLASTNVYASAVFVGISFQFLLEQTRSFGQGPVSLRPLYTRYLVPNLILLAGAFLLVAQLVPIPMPGDPATGGHQLHIRLDRMSRLLWPIFLGLAGLVLFSKTNGFPRIVGGLVASCLAVIPTLFYGCATRHSFMLDLGIVYFLWIYLDDILAKKSAAAQTRVLVIAVLLIAAVCFASKPAGLRGTLRRDWDSIPTARAIIAHNLDSPDTVLVTTEPDKTTPLLMLFKNIRTDYGPPPFPSGPMSFADYYYTGMRKDKDVPSLEQLKPVVLKIAAANPTKTILVISVDTNGTEMTANDPDYQLVHIYSSPVLPGPPNLCEFYQVYVLKR